MLNLILAGCFSLFAYYGYMPLHFAVAMALISLLLPVMARIFHLAGWVSKQQAGLLLQVLMLVVLSGNSFGLYPVLAIGMVGLLHIGFWRSPLLLMAVGVWCEVYFASPSGAVQHEVVLAVSWLLFAIGAGAMLMDLSGFRQKIQGNYLLKKFATREGLVNIYVVDGVLGYEELTGFSCKKLHAMAECDQGCEGVRLFLRDSTSFLFEVNVDRGFYSKNLYLREVQRKAGEVLSEGKGGRTTDHDWSDLITLKAKPLFNCSTGECEGAAFDLYASRSQLSLVGDEVALERSLCAHVEAIADKLKQEVVFLRSPLLIIRSELSMSQFVSDLCCELRASCCRVIQLVASEEQAASVRSFDIPCVMDILNGDHVAAHAIDETYDLLYVNLQSLQRLDDAFVGLLWQLVASLKDEREVGVITQGMLAELQERQIYDHSDYFIIDDESWSVDVIREAPRSLMKVSKGLVPVQAPDWTKDIDLIRLASNGLTNKEIAGMLNISQRTVAYRLKDIYKRVDAKGRSDAIAKLKVLGVV